MARISIGSTYILLFLVAFRLANALIIKTFFQPDEFFQALEPAWAIAFGEQSGAWITWEWRHQLRSYMYPALFAAMYRMCRTAANVMQLSATTGAELLVVVPKIVQAVFAALGDFFTWKLAVKLSGRHRQLADVTLFLTICSPWQWFCSTRTLSNSLETTLTTVALCYWPWRWSSTVAMDVTSKRSPAARQGNLDGLRLSLVMAASATILRPTNVLIWLPLAALALIQCRSSLRLILIREAGIFGSLVAALSIIVDHTFYHHWTFPPLRFLYFNLAQSLAVFYGKNDWHYYLSQGLPLLLTTSLPFGIVGIWQALVPRAASATGRSAKGIGIDPLFQLAIVVMFNITTLSLIAHKEVRFIYPLLPALHLLAAQPLAHFIMTPATGARSDQTTIPRSRKLTMAALIAANIILATYTTRVHQTGVVTVMDYLRHTYEVSHLNRGSGLQDMTVGFLMPCHSTPWRSHLVYPEIQAWALECEPPVNMDAQRRAKYVDDADIFYADPSKVMRNDFRDLRVPPRFVGAGDGSETWPRYLVFFAQLEPVLKETAKQRRRYTECWRGFNTHWHDDARRKGDVVVWCDMSL
ncbi:MAG: hypothetical protein M1817_003603 [Caeruleum heppii]|nr:MAG: hypothetical protein M1817_003603 [Caeruleum heppii]